MVRYFSYARILYMRELHNSYSNIQITKLYYEVKAKNSIGCTYKTKYFDFKNMQKMSNYNMLKFKSFSKFIEHFKSQIHT